MAFSVGTIVPKDLEELSTVIFRAYRGENPYINAAYPNNLTKEGQWAGLQKLRKLTETSEQARWEKVKDETTGKIVALAVWLINEHQKPASAPYHQQSSVQEFESEDAEFAATLRKSFGELQAPFWQENDLPLINLCAMTVTPEYQYQGVGTMLMKSGTQFADEIGAKCTVMATPAARRLYEKSGFVIERDATFQVPEKFATRPAVRLLHMVRERTTQTRD